MRHAAPPLNVCQVIPSLTVGDEIMVRKGIGRPPAEEDVAEIVAAVRGCFALTASGRMLICFDARGVEPTGNHFGEFGISLEAQKILDEMHRLTELRRPVQGQDGSLSFLPPACLLPPGPGRENAELLE